MKNILIVVDMQNGFNRYEQTNKLAKKVVELTTSGIFDTVIATRFLNREGSQYTRIINWHRLMNSPDIDLIEGIVADEIVDKFVYTCVTKDFINLLKKHNDGEIPSHVFICGADTDCCVMKTATDIFEQAIMPIVLIDYCDSNGGPESHNAGILVMNRLVGKKSIVFGKINSKDDVKKIILERQY